MGADIFAHLEIGYRTPNGIVVFERIAIVEFPRDYELFACLAGVRRSEGEISNAAPFVAPRGLPNDASAGVVSAICLDVDDSLAEAGEKWCSALEADRWVTSGASRYLDEHRAAVVDPDVHSASWLLRNELKHAAQRYVERGNGGNVFLEATVAAMDVLEAAALSPRLVFWFKG